MKRIIIISFILVSIFNSCSLDIKLEDQFSDPDAITNSETARQLLASIYNMYPQHQYDLSLLADDFYPTSVINLNSSVRNFYLWREAEISRFSSSVWSAYYSTIAICDILLERIPLIKPLSSEEKQEMDQINAETNILKAMCYFDLLRLFAPAYIPTENQDGIILKGKFGLEFPSRSSIKESIAEIKRLLLSASSLNNNNPSSVAWLSQSTADYILSEVSLYAQEYKDAAEYAQKILAKYPIENISENNYKKLWENADSDERIFAFSRLDIYYSDIEYSEKDGDYFCISDKLLFSATDYRKEICEYPFTFTLTNGTQREARLIGKYNRLNKTDLPIKFINRMSVEGAYFILLEAMANQANTETIDALNNYLTKRGIEPIENTSSKNELIITILEYKQLAFVGEGERYFDLKRTSYKNLLRHSAFGDKIEMTVNTDDYRWTFPIPRSESTHNPNVTQNKGWSI